MPAAVIAAVRAAAMVAAHARAMQMTMELRVLPKTTIYKDSAAPYLAASMGAAGRSSRSATITTTIALTCTAAKTTRHQVHAQAPSDSAKLRAPAQLLASWTGSEA